MKRFYDKLHSREQSLLLLLTWSALLAFGYYAIEKAINQYRMHSSLVKEIPTFEKRIGEGESVLAKIDKLVEGRSNDIGLLQLEINAERLAKGIRTTHEWKRNTKTSFYPKKNTGKKKSSGSSDDDEAKLFDQNSVKITFSRAQWGDLQAFVGKIREDKDLFLSEVKITPKYKTRLGPKKEPIKETDYFIGEFKVSSLQLKKEVFRKDYLSM